MSIRRAKSPELTYKVKFIYAIDGKYNSFLKRDRKYKGT